MSNNFREMIEANEKKRQELIAELIQVKKMVKGSFCQIYVKCGKKNCRCSTGEGHPHWRMSLKERGKSFSRAVPPEEYKWITEMTTNYRKFKKLHKQLLELEIQTKKLIECYEISCTNESKEGKTYLDVQNGSSEGKSKKPSGALKKGNDVNP